MLTFKMNDLQHTQKRTGMNMDYSETTNKLWETDKAVFFSVLTPVYNRPDFLSRVIASVERQSFRHFEYIIVNDGSTVDLDDVVISFMNQATFPVMYIKKPNGGVHTARNAGIRKARGILTVAIDSDDELMPNALEILHRTWLSIPENRRSEYFQISARCITDSGVEGPLFPEKINTLPMEKSAIAYEKVPFEIFIANRTDVLKENPFPEPEGITFVLESILWFKLLRLYRVQCINDILRIYHTEGNDHVFGKTKSIQYVRNMVWSFAFYLNNWKERKTHLKNYLQFILHYTVLIKVLKIKKQEIREDFKTKYFRERFIQILLFVFAWPVAIRYSRRVKD